VTERTVLEWTETREGAWFASNAEFYIWQEWAAIGGKCWVLSNDDWHGPTIGPDFPTIDGAKACAQRIQDAIDGYDRLEEVLARVEALKNLAAKHWDGPHKSVQRAQYWNGYLTATERALHLLRETR